MPTVMPAGSCSHLLVLRSCLLLQRWVLVHLLYSQSPARSNPGHSNGSTYLPTLAIADSPREIVLPMVLIAVQELSTEEHTVLVQSVNSPQLDHH
jgi:hypothetical protein